MIEDDNLEEIGEVQLSSSKAANHSQAVSGHAGFAAAAAHAVDTAAGAFTGLQTESSCDKTSKAASILDRIPGLSSVLDGLPHNSAPTAKAKLTAAATPASLKQGDMPPSVSLLDAIMNADDASWQEAAASPVEPEPTGAAQQSEGGTDADPDDVAGQEAQHSRAETQPGSGQGQGLGQAAGPPLASATVKASAPVVKGSLRERLKALGVINS